MPRTIGEDVEGGFTQDEIKGELRRRLLTMAPSQREAELEKMRGRPGLEDVVAEFTTAPGAWTEEAFKPVAPVKISGYVTRAGVTTPTGIKYEPTPEPPKKRLTWAPPSTPPTGTIPGVYWPGGMPTPPVGTEPYWRLPTAEETIKAGGRAGIEAAKTVGRTFQGKKPFGLFEIGKPEETPPPSGLPELVGRAVPGFLGFGEPLTLEELRQQPPWMQAAMATGMGAPLESLSLAAQQAPAAFRVGTAGLKERGRAVLATGERGAVGPFEKAPPPKAPRRPVWEGKLPTEEAAAAEVAGDTGGVPPKLPSGRVPGGPVGKKPPDTPNNYKLLQDSLTPDTPALQKRITLATNKILRAMYWNGYDLRKLAKESGIAVDDLFQVIRGHLAEGENNVRLYIQPVFKALGHKLIPRLEEYMTLMSEQDLAARSPGALLPGKVQGLPGTIKALNMLKAQVGAKNFSKIEAAAKEIWQRNDEFILKFMKDEGFIDDASYTRIRSANPHYVDLARGDFADLVGQAEQRMTNAAASVSSTGLEVRSLVGSTRKLDEPLARTVGNFIRMPMVAARNRAAKAIGQALRELQGADDGELFHILKPGETGENSKIKQTISWFENGQQVRAEVPAEFGVIAKNAEAEATNAFSKFFSTIGKPLQAGATAYNPAFVAFNPWWDTISASFRVKGYGFWRREFWQGWAAAFWKNENFNNAARAGVFQSGLVESARSIKDIARSAGRGTFTVRSFGDAVKLIPRLINEAAITGERATRIGGYLYLKGKGYSELEAAIKGGRDITVDFSKAGTVMKLINTAIPFSNAGVQGIANAARTMRDNPAQMLRVGAPLAFLAVMAKLNNARFESGNKINPELSYRNWVFQVGEYVENPDPAHPDQKPERFPITITIPKGPLVGPLMMPVETLLDIAFRNNNRSVVETVLSTTKGVMLAASPFSPDVTGIMPPLAGTAVQLATGQNVYAGRPIIPERERNLLPEQQFGPETGKVAVLLGQKFKVSPRLIDFAIRDYTAGAGQTTSWVAGMGLQAVGFQPETYGAAFAQQPTGIQQVSYMPGISRVLKTSGTRLESEGWRDLDQAVEDTRRTLVTAFPELNRLGITFGTVGNQIAGRELKPAERAEYQRLSGDLAKDKLTAIMGSPQYQREDDAHKKALIQEGLAEARQFARFAIDDFVGTDVEPTYNDYQDLARTFQKILQPYLDIDDKVWGRYPVEVKYLDDEIAAVERTDPKEAKRKLYQSPASLGTAVLKARTEIEQQRKAMLYGNERLSKLLKFYNTY